MGMCPYRRRRLSLRCGWGRSSERRRPTPALGQPSDKLEAVARQRIASIGRRVRAAEPVRRHVTHGAIAPAIADRRVPWATLLDAGPPVGRPVLAGGENLYPVARLQGQLSGSFPVHPLKGSVSLYSHVTRQFYVNRKSHGISSSYCCNPAECARD